jgi:hypothetical protein
MAVDSSILDPPRIRPTADPKAYLQAVVNWHFGAETGSPHCLRRATSLDLDPQTDISNFEGLVLLPNIVDELRKALFGRWCRKTLALTPNTRGFRAWRFCPRTQPGHRHAGLGGTGHQVAGRRRSVI